MVGTLGKFGSSQTSKIISQNWLTIIIKSVGKAAATFYLFFFFSCQSIRPWPNIGQNLKVS